MRAEGYEAMEQRFIKAYKRHGNNSFMVLLDFYKGQYHKFLVSTLFFVIKHSPSLFSALLVANVINAALEGGESGMHKILLNVGIWLVLLAIHLPANWIHNAYKSRVIRRTEAGLRGRWPKNCRNCPSPTIRGCSRAACNPKSSATWKRWRLCPLSCSSIP